MATRQVQAQGDRHVVSRLISSADAATTVQAIDVPAGTLVKSVWLVITTAITGGSPSWNVGDGDDTDGWIATADITEATAGTYKGIAANTASYSNTGRYYASADTIDVIVTTGMTAGSAFLVASMIPVDEAII